MNHTYALGLLLTLSIMSPLSAVRAAEPSHVLLSEIAWAGSEKSTADEWLTLRNTGTTPVDISGWSLTGAGTSGAVLTIPPDTVLSAGQTYLIANYPVGDKSTLLLAPNMVTTAISLPNTGLNVTLIDSSGNTVDALLDAGAPDFGSSATFATMKRDLSNGSWFTEAASSYVHVSAIPTEDVPLSEPVIEVLIESSEPIPESVIELPPAVIEIVEIPSSDPVPSTVEATVPPLVAEEAVAIEAIPIVESTAPSVPLEPVVIDSVTTPIIDEPVQSAIDDTPSAISIPILDTEIDQTLATTPTPTSTVSVIITELFPSPNTGEDEWVTLQNTTGMSVNLDGYTLVDASGKVTVLTGSIEPNGFIRILNPEGNLNNDGDSVFLMLGDTVVDAVSYGNDSVAAPKKNTLLALIDGAWTAGTEETSPSVIDPVVSETPIESPVPSIPNEVADSLSPLEATPESLNLPAITIRIGDIILTEILPSPSTGYDEWVELYNTTDSPISLESLTLMDASGKATALAGALDAYGYTLIVNPSGNLNNDGDSITLMSGDTVLDAMNYGDDIIPAPKKDVTLALVDGVWITGTPTPAAPNTDTIAESLEVSSSETATETLTPTISPTLYANSTTSVADATSVVTTSSHQSPSSTGSATSHTNIVAAPVKSSTTTHSVPAATTGVTTVSLASSTPKSVSSTKTPAKTAVKKSTASTKAIPRSVTIEAIASLADDTLVTLEGIVVAEVGILGKRSFFLDGLEVYQGSGTLADVHVGDRVTITGKVSVLSDHRRVNIQENSVIARGSADPIIHDYAPDLLYGSLVRVTGTVSARDGNAVLLKTNEGTVITVVPGNGVTIAWADFAGATITATGIVKHGEQEILVLRSASDLVVEKVSEPIAAATITATASSQTSMFWAVGALLAVASAGFGLWVWYTRPTARTTKLILNPTTV